MSCFHKDRKKSETTCFLEAPYPETEHDCGTPSTNSGSDKKDEDWLTVYLGSGEMALISC